MAECYVGFGNELADCAGSVILRYWRRPFGIDEKVESGRAMASSPVTEADRGAEREMRELIASRFPSHGIRGEEFGESLNFASAEWQWVLDPIDGTKSFMTGKPVFGTLIALCRHGTPVLGIIDQCVQQERWIGYVDERNEFTTTLNGVPVKNRPASCETLREAFAYATTPDMFAKGEETEKFLDMKNRVKRMLYGCDCYAYALLASGFGPSIVIEADLQPYDFLALVPVVKGAGCLITDWQGNDLTLKSKTGRVIACANRPLFKEAIALLSAKKTPTISPIALAFAAGAACAFILARATTK